MSPLNQPAQAPVEVEAATEEPKPWEGAGLDDSFVISAEQSNFDLRAASNKIAEIRRADLHTDHVLEAMDKFFTPYAKPADPRRSLKELADTLPIYMKLDEILMGADEGDPLRKAADHRIELMKNVPDGEGPLWYRQLRLRAQIDLFWFIREVLGKSITNYAHRGLIEHLVQKDPRLPIAEQSSIKTRLTMCCRGYFKSTISVCDCLQWICGFPNIRIIIFTSVGKLSKKFVAEIKQYLILPEEAEPTVFQTLFPECCMRPSDSGTATEFIVPSRTAPLKDSTVFSASVDSEEVGAHADVIVYDDVETDKTASTSEMIEDLKTTVGLSKALLDPGGQRHFIGTPYNPESLYYFLRDSVDGIQFFFRPAFEVRPECANKPQDDLIERDVKLAFPERITWADLQSTKRENPGVFQSQYLLNPMNFDRPTFNLEMLQARTIDENQVPHDVNTIISWDIAYTRSLKSDFSVGAVIAQSLSDGRAFVREIIRDRFDPEGLCEAIVDSYIKWRPTAVIIEGSLGADAYRMQIDRIAREKGLGEIPLYFIPVSRKSGAKAVRVAALQPVIFSGRLLFSNNIDCLTDLYNEFAFFGVASHDDIPDAIALAFASGYISQRLVPLTPEAMKQTRTVEKVWNDLEQYNHIFGVNGPAEPQVPEAPIDPPFNEEDLIQYF